MQDAENRQEQQGVQLQGTVERVVFRNEDNGWTVMEAVSYTHLDVYKRQVI